jgi:hypothetical protein
MLNELTCVIHVADPSAEPIPTKPKAQPPTGLHPQAPVNLGSAQVKAQKMNPEESKHKPESQKSGSSVEIEVGNRKYFTEEIVLFKHFKLTLEIFFQSFEKASINNIVKG